MPPVKYTCPECGSPLRYNPKYDFWGCSAYPVCKVTFSNLDGQPHERQHSRNSAKTDYVCPKCAQPLFLRKGTSKSGEEFNFMTCGLKTPACGLKFDVLATGVPDFNNPQPPTIITPSQHLCPKCGNTLSLRQGLSRQSNKPYRFFFCTAQDPKCEETFEVLDDGTPDFTHQSRKRPENMTDFICPSCKRNLFHNKGIVEKTGKPYSYFTCGAKAPSCGARYGDLNNQPDFNNSF